MNLPFYIQTELFIYSKRITFITSVELNNQRLIENDSSYSEERRNLLTYGPNSLGGRDRRQGREMMMMIRV